MKVAPCVPFDSLQTVEQIIFRLDASATSESAAAVAAAAVLIKLITKRSAREIGKYAKEN